LARIILPVVLGTINSLPATFGVIGALCFVCCVAVLVYYYLVQEKEKQAQQDSSYARLN